jgi:hypothetical protein
MTRENRMWRRAAVALATMMIVGVSGALLIDGLARSLAR